MATQKEGGGLKLKHRLEAEGLPVTWQITTPAIAYIDIAPNIVANNSSSDHAPTRTPSTSHDIHTGNMHTVGNTHYNKLPDWFLEFRH